MQPIHRPARRLAVPTLALVLAMSAASCGSDTTTSGTGDPTTSSAAPTTVGTTKVTTAGTTPPGSALPEVPGQVDIVDYELLPPTITIAAGESVTFVNHDDVDHYLVTEDETTVHTDPIPPGERSVGTIATPGTYAYYCEIHNAMTGTIIVE